MKALLTYLCGNRSHDLSLPLSTDAEERHKNFHCDVSNTSNNKNYNIDKTLCEL